MSSKRKRRSNKKHFEESFNNYDPEEGDIGEILDTLTDCLSASLRKFEEHFRQDVIQATFVVLIRTFRRTGRLKKPGLGFASSSDMWRWTNSVAWRKAITSLKRENKYNLECKWLNQISDQSPDVQKVLECEEGLGLLLAAIDKLNPSSAEIFRLRLFEGLSFDEIAKQKRITKRAVENQYQRAKNKIKSSPELGNIDWIRLREVVPLLRKIFGD